MYRVYYFDNSTNEWKRIATHDLFDTLSEALNWVMQCGAHNCKYKITKLEAEKTFAYLEKVL